MVERAIDRYVNEVDPEKKSLTVSSSTTQKDIPFGE